MKIYAVYHGLDTRLIRANSRAQALAHAAKTSINIHMATQDELIDLPARGIKVENVKDADQTELDLGE